MPWIEPDDYYTCVCDACGTKEEFYREESHYNSPREHGIWGADDEDLVDDWIPAIQDEPGFKGSAFDRDWSHVKGQGYVVFCSKCCDDLRKRKLLKD